MIASRPAARLTPTLPAVLALLGGGALFLATSAPLAAEPGDADANKALVRAYYETVLNRPEVDLEGAERFLPQDVPAVHPETVAAREARKRSLVPDLRYEIREMVAEGDRVVVRFQEVGTHSGSSQDAPATGNRLEIDGVAIYTVRDGKIRSRWALDDMLGLMRTVGYRVTAPGH